MSFAKPHTSGDTTARRVDDIARVRSWREQMRKEKAIALTYKHDREYVPNPKTLVVLPDDPNHVSFESRVRPRVLPSNVSLSNTAKYKDISLESLNPGNPISMPGSSLRGPAATSLSATVDAAAEEDPIFTRMKRSQALPQAKYSYPATVNQEYGFYSYAPLLTRDDPVDQGGFYRGLKSCEVSKFSDSYAQSWGTSPFHKAGARILNGGAATTKTKSAK